MRKPVEFSIVREGNGAILRLSRDITEGIGATLEEAFQQLSGAQILQIHLNGLNRINSVGCAEWTAAISPFFQGRLVEFHQCPVPFIDYCNLFPRMLGPLGGSSNGIVVNFMVPFACTQCQESVEALVSTKIVITTRVLPPQICKECGGSMVAEVDHNDYLIFLDVTM